MQVLVHPRTLVDLIRWPAISRPLIQNMVLIVGFSWFIALVAQIRIMLPDNPVPITFQTLAVLLGGAALGSKRGVAGVGLYLLQGLVGLPVFAGGNGGQTYILGATGGYLFSYLLVAFVTGWLTERGWDRKYLTTLALMLAGLICNYGLGVTWLAIASGKGINYAIEKGMLPFLIVDLAKVIVAASLLPLAWWLVRRK